MFVMAALFVPKHKVNISCPICLDHFSRPRSLPCLHTFCEKCLNEHILNSRSNALYNGFFCPVCRAETKPGNPYTLRETWIDQFPVNHWIVSVMDEGLHDSPSSSLTVTCHCHQDYLVNLFCSDHQALCCPMCVATTHRKCEVVKEIDQIVQEGNIQDETKSILKDMEEIEDYVDTLKDSRMISESMLNISREELVSTVKEEAEVIVAHVTNLADRLLREIDQEHKKLKQEVYHDVKWCDDIKKTIKNSVTKSLNMLKLNSPHHNFMALHAVRETYNTVQGEVKERQTKSKEAECSFVTHEMALNFHENFPSLGYLKTTKSDLSIPLPSCIEDQYRPVTKEMLSPATKDKFKWRSRLKSEEERRVQSFSAADNRRHQNTSPRERRLSFKESAITASDVHRSALAIAPSLEQAAVAEANSQITVKSRHNEDEHHYSTIAETAEEAVSIDFDRVFYSTERNQRKDFPVMFQLNVKSDVERDCFISSTECLPRKCFLLADFHNYKLKMFREDSKLLCDFPTQDAPWCIARIDEKRVAVTYPMDRTLRLFDASALDIPLIPMLSPSLKCIDSFKLDMECYGVTFINKVLVVTCSSCLKTFTSKGKVLQVVKDDNREPLFCKATYIAKDEPRNVVYVSDEAKNTVSSFLVVDKAISKNPRFTYQHDDLQNPQGLAVDSQGSIYVCGFVSCNIHVLNIDGQLRQVIPYPRQPWSITIDSRKRRVLLSDYPSGLSSNAVYCYKEDEFGQTQCPDTITK